MFYVLFSPSHCYQGICFFHLHMFSLTTMTTLTRAMTPFLFCWLDKPSRAYWQSINMSVTGRES